MKGKIFIGLFILLINICATGLAEVRLPKLFSDNMVLQRDQVVNIWGWANPDEKIKLSFRGNQYKIKADNSGDWSIQIPPVPAGGPYDLYITGENSIHLTNILFGDIWLCSGQSNMYFKVRAAKQAYKDINNANYDNIRLFQIEKDASSSPKKDLSSGDWLIGTGSILCINSSSQGCSAELHGPLRLQRTPSGKRSHAD